MSLSNSISSDTWIQAGGFYKSDGVFFFANEEYASQGTVAATTGIDLVICESMSLSSSTLVLHVVSIWNSKVALSKLKQAA